MILIYAILAWGLVLSTCWLLVSQCQTGLVNVQRLHQVPCYKCKYFTNSRYLKCTVNPYFACSEAAIDCHDYQPQQSMKL
jgi:hypothetical protein